MLLVADIGNTSSTFGLFDGEKLIKKWHALTEKDPIAAGVTFDVNVRDGLPPKLRKKSPLKHDLDGIIISSVVPEGDASIKKVVRFSMEIEPLFVDHTNAGIKIDHNRPHEIGADRLVNAVAAWNKFKRAAIVVDMGTATTLDIVSSKGVFSSGAIAPGIWISLNSLSKYASKLPEIEIVKTGKFLTRSTVEAMQVGIYQGYIGLIEKLVAGTAKAMKEKPVVIATGGFAPIISKGTQIFHHVDCDITLEGLRQIYEAGAVTKDS